MPGVSVIVPTYRRPALLERCLRGLLGQRRDPGLFEIIVCDDAPSAGAFAVVSDLSRASAVSLHYLAVSGTRGPAGARNAGAACARFEVLAFIDDDCVPDPGWLDAGTAALEDHQAGAATGRIVVPLSKRPTDYERNEAGLAGSEFVTANLFCRKEVFLAAGGFDTSFHMAWREDSDLQFRLLERGIPIVRVPEALVVHPVRPARWGVGLRMQKKSMFDALLYKKHPHLYRQRIAGSPPLNYYFIVGSFAAAVVALFLPGRQPDLLLLSIWLALTIRFFWMRIRGASRSISHIAELAVTSLFIPFLSVFWRLYGALTFKVAFF